MKISQTLWTSLKTGQSTWRNAETHTVENVGKNAQEALDIELKK